MFDVPLRPFQIQTGGRFMAKMNGYIQTLSREVLYNMHRYTRGPYTENSGMLLLEHILGAADVETIRKEPDHYARYRKFLIPAKESLERIFDPTQQGLSKNGSFVDSSHKDTKQYFLPVSTDSIYSDLPFNGSWEAWKRVRPFHAASLLTNELTFHAYQDDLKYRNDPPAVAVFTIDVCALVLMYCSYLDAIEGTEADIPTKVPVFLHQYVVYPNLQLDSVQLWIRNQYHECLTRSISTESSHKDYVWVTANNGRIGSQYPQFVEDVYSLMGWCKEGSLLPNSFLESLHFLNGDTFLSLYKKVRQSLTVPALRQYRWSEYLIYERWLDFFIRVMLLNPQWSEFYGAATYLQRDLRLFSLTRPWVNITDTFTQTYIQTSINDKLDFLENALAGKLKPE